MATTLAQHVLKLIPNRSAAIARAAVERYAGILPMMPEFVPRDFLLPGCRLGVVVEHQYAAGPHRGKLCERWIGSCTTCDNGPYTLEYEGISKVVHDGKRIPLTWILDEYGGKALGHLANWYRNVPGYYNKLFDFFRHIPHHLHQEALKAYVNGQPSMIGDQRVGKAEGYKHLTQYNHPKMAGDQVATWFGLRPGTTREDVARALAAWEVNDNLILSHAQAQLIGPHRNWFVPSGYLHAPGPMITEEPQEGTDVFSMFQNAVEGKFTPRVLLTKNFDSAAADEPDALAGLVDLELNARPPEEFMITPSLRRRTDEMVETWEVFGRDPIGGYIPFVLLESVVAPGKQATFAGEKFHSVFCVEGNGTIGLADRSVQMPIGAPRSFRYGELANDEFVILADRADGGYTVQNTGSGPLVLHRCFGRDSFPESEVPQVGLRAPVDLEALQTARLEVFGS